MALTAGQTGHLADHQEGVYTVVHGATAGTTRPTLGSSSTSPTVVLWVGSVEPTNAVNNDLWMDTTSGSPNSKVKVSGSFVTAGSGTYAPADGVAARVYLGTTAQSIPNTSLTAISFNAEAFDTDLIHDNSTNPNRLTVPAGQGGLWHVAATIQYAASTGGALRGAIIRVNGTTVVADNNPGATAYHSTRHVSVSAAVTLDLDAGDYVEVMAYQDSGGALNVNFGEQKTHASIHRLGGSPLA